LLMLFWWLAGESWMVLRDVISDDEAWAVIGPLFPKVKATGRPPVDRLTVVDAAAWRLRTGAPWRDVPERFGSWNTIYRSLNRWAEDGVWARVLEMPQSLAHQAGDLDLVVSIDSTIVPAPVRRDSPGGHGGSIEPQQVR
jgi:hypothetical protein